MQGEAVKRSPQLAADLARFDRRTRVQEALAADEMRTAVRTVPKTRAAKKTKLGLKLSSVMLFVYFMGVVLLIVFSYAKLSTLIRDNSSAAKLLSEAQKKQAVLEANFESRIKLDEITEIATGRLGMVKLDRRQISYIDMSGEEKVEIFSDELTLNVIKNKIARGFESLIEFFL